MYSPFVKGARGILPSGVLIEVKKLTGWTWDRWEYIDFPYFFIYHAENVISILIAQVLKNEDHRFFSPMKR